MIQKLLESIKASVLANSRFQSCWIYPEPREKIVAPAVFIEAGSFSAGSDPATGELALIANIEARVVMDALAENSEVACQSLACELANIAHLNSFGCDVSPAIVTGISRDAFKPDFDGYLCWLVEWTHEFHCGENIWLENGIPPHEIFVNKEQFHD